MKSSERKAIDSIGERPNRKVSVSAPEIVRISVPGTGRAISIASVKIVRSPRKEKSEIAISTKKMLHLNLFVSIFLRSGENVAP
jgi:hypothetical protein